MEQIILITSKEGGIYQSFVDSFTEEYLKETELTSRSKLKVISLDHLSQNKNVLEDKNTLVITIGVKAAKFVAKFELETPVVHAMLPFSTYQKMVSQQKQCATQSAIYIEQPVKRQIALSKLLFPGRNSFGFLLGSLAKKRYDFETKIQPLPAKKFKTRLIEESRELAWSLRDLSEEVDVFIALNDPLVFNPNNAKWLLYMAYQEAKPVIGFSKPYVSAGASAAVFSTPKQLGKQTATQIVKQYQSKSECLFKPQYPSDFSVSINKAVVESLSGRDLNEKALYKMLVRQERKK